MTDHSSFDETVPSGPPDSGPAPLRPAPGPIGNQFGPYQILEEIARGGQGAVLKARHMQLGTVVALKILLDTEPRAVARFQQEAKILARLRHRNLLTVSDLGEVGGRPYLAMEYVEGKDLNALVKDSGVPELTWIAEVLGAVANVLHYCHGNGIVHRDLKPANILLERQTGRPILVDFGLVKRDPQKLELTADATPLSQTGELKGTPSYMAPEQADPGTGEVGPHTDVYALGATLYFLLTGRPPFEGASLINVLNGVLTKPAPDPLEVNDSVPRALSLLCLAALDKEPRRRPRSAAAFGDQLEAAAAKGEAEGAPGALRRFLVRRKRAQSVVLGLIVFLGGIGAGFAIREAPATPVAKTTARDPWNVTRLLLAQGQPVPKSELAELERRAALDKPAWAKWIPYARVHTQILSGKANEELLDQLPEGPARDLLRAKVWQTRLGEVDVPALFQLLERGETSRLPWRRARPADDWRELAEELSSIDTLAAARATLRAASRVASEAERLRLVERAFDRHSDTAATEGGAFAELLLRAGTADLLDLEGRTARRVARGRRRLFRYRLLRPETPLPGELLRALRRLARHHETPLRNAILPAGAWEAFLSNAQVMTDLERPTPADSPLRTTVNPTGFPQAWRRLFKIADALTGRRRRQIYLLQYWLLWHPEVTYLWSELGYRHYVLQDYDATVRPFEIARARCKRSKASDFLATRLGGILNEQGRFADCVRLLTPLAGRNRSPWLHYHLSTGLLGVGRAQQALDVLEQRVALPWQRRPAFYEKRAEILGALGKHQQARANWRRGAELRRTKR